MIIPEAPPSNVQKEFMMVRRQYRLAALVALLLISGGAIFYHRVEHFGWLDSFYFCTITLATVGYGDFVPHTSAGKLFTIFYVLIGIGIFAFFVNTLVKNAVLRREVKRSKKASMEK